MCKENGIFTHNEYYSAKNKEKFKLFVGKMSTPWTMMLSEIKSVSQRERSYGFSYWGMKSVYIANINEWIKTEKKITSCSYHMILN